MKLYCLNPWQSCICKPETCLLFNILSNPLNWCCKERKITVLFSCKTVKNCLVGTERFVTNLKNSGLFDAGFFKLGLETNMVFCNELKLPNTHFQLTVSKNLHSINIFLQLPVGFESSVIILKLSLLTLNQ
jgi:hypothetical protein